MPPRSHRVDPPLRSQYRILAVIGSGQFGRVYCAQDRITGEMVAMKDLHPRRFPTRLFLRELRLLVGLQHPNIVGFRALEYTAKGRYLVMDYCEAGTLRDLMDADVQLSLSQRLHLVLDILRGLDYAHQSQVIHCDLKPENILLSLTPQGWTAKISDFGIARLMAESKSGVMGLGATGSPAYMAPERFYGQFSVESDLYSVGVMLFELLVGERPFSGLPGTLMAAHLNDAVVIPESVPFLLRSQIVTALQKLPHHRFATAAEMLKSLELAVDVLTHQEQGQPPMHWRITIAPTRVEILREEILDLEPADIAPENVSERVIERLPNHISENVPENANFQAQQPLSLRGARYCAIPSGTTQILFLDSRHGLALIPEFSTGSTILVLVNRRGQHLGQLSIPKLLRSVMATEQSFSTSNRNPPNQCFAFLELASPDDTATGLIITLKPYQLRLVPLDFVPKFSVSRPWGILFVSASGLLLGIDWSAHRLGLLQLPLHQPQRLVCISVLSLWQVQVTLQTPTQSLKWNIDLSPTFGHQSARFASES